MLRLTILRYSLQLVLACSSYTTYSFLSPLGILLAYFSRGLPTRVRYTLGSLLLLAHPPLAYWYILCNTYSSISRLFLSDIRLELTRTVFLLELLGYLTFVGDTTVRILLVVDLVNSITLLKPPREEKTEEEMVLKIKLLLKDYVYRSQEYKAIFGGQSTCSGLTTPTTCTSTTTSPYTVDLLTGIILLNKVNVYSFYSVALSLLPFPKFSLLIFPLAFFYTLHLHVLSLLLTPFCDPSFLNSSIYLRALCINLTLFFYTLA